jgi:CheY-like chemotaxis protein
VLVVDDEPGVREVAGAMLRRAGLSVLLAADGTDAVDQYLSHAASIDAVLLDLTMPRMGGADAFEAIRAIRPDARVILTSGYSEEEAGSRFVGRGLAGFLQKPFTADELARAVSAALEGANKGKPDPTRPGEAG